MSTRVVLLDLENNATTAQNFRDLIEHYSTIYVFNLKGEFNFPLAQLTEFSSWVVSGQIVVLDTLEAEGKEFEYAVIVGQLLALLSPETHIEVISTSHEALMLTNMMSASGLNCHLTQIESAKHLKSTKFKIPTAEKILATPQLLKIKRYCDIVESMSGKPNTVEKLKNSLANTLQIEDKEASKLLGSFINLKIIKRDEDKISFRKKLVKEWAAIRLDGSTNSAISAVKVIKIDSLLSKLNIDPQQILEEITQLADEEDIHSDLNKNFEKIDPVQMEVIQKLNELKANKPKDIYALRDLLEQLFPKSDVRLLLKEMIDKGYIYWNGHEVLYSHEMFLN